VDQAVAAADAGCARLRVSNGRTCAPCRVPSRTTVMALSCPVLSFLADGDGWLSTAEALQCARRLVEETQRREVEEDAAGISGLLFDHVDADKSGTIELRGALYG
jgi:hypothetical protein